jgi:hypothetical protein
VVSPPEGQRPKLYMYTPCVRCCCCCCCKDVTLTAAVKHCGLLQRAHMSWGMHTMLTAAVKCQLLQLLSDAGGHGVMMCQRRILFLVHGAKCAGCACLCSSQLHFKHFRRSYWVCGALCMSCRNVHPTTQLLQPFPGSPHLPPGILAISSRGVQLCTCLGSNLVQPGSSNQAISSSAALREASSSSAADAGSSLMGAGVCVRQAELLQWTLGGLPLSCVALSDGGYLVGDSRAGGKYVGLLILTVAWCVCRGQCSSLSTIQ